MSDQRVLLIASNFPPVLGGSASVYMNLAGCAPDDIIVLAPSHNYLDDTPIEGWQAHDAAAPYHVSRLPLLRTVMTPRAGGPAARLRFLAGDVLLRARVLARVLSLVAFRGVRTVCIGELLSIGWLARLLRFLPGVTTAVYIHGEEITTADSYDPQHLRAQQAIRDSDVAIVVSSFTLQAVRALLGPAHAKPVVMIQNGVNTHVFHPAPKPAHLVARHGLEGRFTFLSVCRLVEKKGIDNAIRAFRSVSAAHPEARFVVVGWGEFEARLRAIAAEEGLTERVIFAGRVADDELADYYRLGDVFVMPNRRMPDGDTEGFGLVFLEANRCGLPVVAGRDGGSTDAVQDGLNGLVVDGHSVPAIAEAMRRLAEDPALYDRLREGGLRRSAEAGWEGKARDFLAALRPARPGGPQLPLGLLLSLPLLVLALPWLLLLRLRAPASPSDA